MSEMLTAAAAHPVPTEHPPRQPQHVINITIHPGRCTFSPFELPDTKLYSQSIPTSFVTVTPSPPSRTGPLPAFPLPPSSADPLVEPLIKPMPSDFAFFPSPCVRSYLHLPDPAAEHARQVSLHYALKHLSAHTGVDVWGRIKGHLATVHAEGRRSSVLDLGCGTGIFSYELGMEEEYADVIGVDIDLTQVGSSVESETPYNNVDFTPLDITQPLPYASASFDCVHIRNLAPFVPQYLQLVERCARILRPGGLLVVTELEHFYHSAAPGYVPAACLRTWQTALREALRGRSGTSFQHRTALISSHRSFSSLPVDPDVPSRLRLIVSNSGVFESDMMVEELGIPTGGAHVAADHFDPDMIAASFETLQPILLEHGYGKDDIDQLNNDCVVELTEVDNRYFQRSTTICATKLRY